MKAMPEGFLSTHLVAGVEPGTVVRLAAPQGNFVLPDPAPRSMLFVTAGSGITPVMSMLRTLVRRNQITDIAHLHSAPTEADVMFGAELAALTDDHPGYRLKVRTTRTEGRLDLARLGEEVPDWRDRQTWACGPPPCSTRPKRSGPLPASATGCTSSASRCPRRHPPAPAARSRSPAAAGRWLPMRRHR
ncbi:stearoyl-CoA 9-desaturase electron transfer partner [Mycobacterium kansasii]|uniref:Stearoyl-CoA 9-desaturase electron transfer partner n=1 Tax=Mycobacterium kansasii TaxID=1768 RepID=A0A1V3XW98_MYCKA|nr:stearoyl-CoA 9-desaturase electron transfer partner [Mycobacterium kansasii]